MADRLKGKVALVVGAGSIGPGWGNGKATAVAFAREGARVFCADINLTAAEETVGIIKGEGGEALAHRADASKAADACDRPVTRTPAPPFMSIFAVASPMPVVP